MPLEGLKERAEVGLVLPPDSDRIGDKPAAATCTRLGVRTTPRVEMEGEARRVPVETQKLDQPSRLPFQVAD